MADFLPPPGPPPPRVPEGWAARWNDQYKEWFYVNIYTKASQWEKPTEPAYPPGEAPPLSPPPGYAPGPSPPPPIDSKSPHPSNPFSPQNTGADNSSSRVAQEEADAELARRLQAEENARGHGGPSPAPGSRGGAASSFYEGQGNPGYGGGANNPPPGAYGGYDQPPYGQQQQYEGGDTKDRGKGGLLGKLLGKAKQSRGGGSQGGYGGYGSGFQGQQGGYGGGGFQGQQGGYGGGGFPGQYGGGGFQGQQGGYGGMPYGGGGGSGGSGRTGGMGAGKAAALGAGAGLLGGALIADVMMHEQEESYEQGFDAGANSGGDYGGGDYDGGGGDFDGGF